MQSSVSGFGRALMVAAWVAVTMGHARAEAMQCTHLPVVATDGEQLTGIEDMALDRAHNRVLLSAYDRHAVDEALAAGRAVPTGGLFWLALEQFDAASVTSLTATRIGVVTDGPLELLPHGIGLFDHDGVRRVGAVNRVALPDGISGEVLFFDASGDLLHLIGRAGGDQFCRANDVAVVDGATAVVTYDQQNCGGWGLWAERAFNKYSAGVLRVAFGNDGAVKTRKLLSSVAFANGIELDGQGQAVVAASRDQAVYAYALDDLLAGDTDATVVARLEGAPDNITISTDGTLVVAVHPQSFALFLHMNGLADVPDSQVVRIAPDGTSTSLVDVHTPGVPGAATTALEAAGKLLVSSAWDHGLGVCTPPPAPGSERG